MVNGIEVEWLLFCSEHQTKLKHPQILVKTKTIRHKQYLQVIGTNENRGLEELQDYSSVTPFTTPSLLTDNLVLQGYAILTCRVEVHTFRTLFLQRISKFLHRTHNAPGLPRSGKNRFFLKVRELCIKSVKF